MRSLGGNPTQAQLKSIIADEKLTAPFDFQRFIRTLPYISISQKSKNNFLIPAVMAEGKEYAEVKRSHQPLPILEVLCKSTSKIRHFAAGTEAGFAVSLINKRLLSNGGSGAGGGGNCLLATHVEAVKEGEEEPVSFGPSALLVDYGSGWKLQTAIESNGNKEEVRIRRERVQKANAEPELFGDSYPTASKQSSPISLVYIGKILLAFLLLFVFGAAFTLLLENLPQFILYINSSI